MWSRFGDAVAMMLTIDGLNTLNRQRQRLGLGAARVISPAEDWEGKPSQTVEGWSDFGVKKQAVGETVNVTMKRFRFVDISTSVAGRQSFTDSIGLITAAFYQRAGRALGVGEGPAEQRQLQIVDFRPGRLVGVVNIRYVDENDLERILNR